MRRLSASFPGKRSRAASGMKPALQLRYQRADAGANGIYAGQPIFGAGLLQESERIMLRQVLGVDGNSGALDCGIGEAAFEDGPVDDLAYGRKGVLDPAHGGACRLVAADESIGLTAMQQPQCYGGKRGMKERALSLDDIPMVGIISRAQPFCGAGDEIGDYRVDGDTPAGDEEAGLPGCAEVGFHVLRDHFAFQGEGSVFLADRTVGAHRQDAKAGPLVALARSELHVVVADIMQPPPGAPGSFSDRRYGAQALVQTRRDVEA